MLPVSFQPFPVLQTERLLLRQLTEADAPGLFAMRSNPDLMRYIPRPLASTTEDAVQLVRHMAGLIDRNEAINWGIFRAGTDELIGMIGFVRFMPERYRAEVGYMLHGDAHGKGYVSEALRAVLDHGFRGFGLHTIEALVNPANTPSVKVLERAGFDLSGTFRDYIYFDGRFIDSLVFSLVSPLPFQQQAPTP
ncbi:MAG: alanine acetyltransferase [Flaviaesturariibacter sp.]|nr:alanine acetyltransferase [Flaviaesturariibacter sp.]